MSRVFITGITGFLGSNIGRYLIEDGHTVAAIYRGTSSKKLCAGFEDQIDWILQDESNWTEKAEKFSPEIIIHSAWLGVSHLERNIWDKQLENIEFVKQLLLIAKSADTKKVIALGSQAEYGMFEGCVAESHQLKPTEAYGSVKIVCSELLKQFCNSNNIDWYWLRLFSVFGSGESENWLIPTLINKLLTSNYMDLTPGEQKYAYLYADDLGRAINNIIVNKGKSGVYNISAKQPVSLKNLVTTIRDQVNPKFELHFGKLEYRENQAMHIQGDVTKFIEAFGEFELSDFKQALALTIDSIKGQFKIKQANESI
ncbi:NAD(P)-dependent oxidoreductase [Mucilaginibacter sp. dw_454]|uniref:NAD-dependent epimerase/dehydratase family protein n=1 Tax=Mucilaginibacter sp. dw_454 TaxID=2720079 RepID=UPI001BD211DC|nr:NAD(P)-dependent oxidoreductase [Mucilaginibacter sp. dw_454]